MAIWKQAPTLEHLHTIHLNTAPAALGLEFLEVGDDYIKGRVPVDRKRPANPS